MSAPSSDFMRTHLVTRFACVKCGTVLHITYQQPKRTFDVVETDDGITGAAKVEQRIGVYPCEPCFEKANRAADALRAALEAVGMKGSAP